MMTRVWLWLWLLLCVSVCVEGFRLCAWGVGGRVWCEAAVLAGTALSFQCAIRAVVSKLFSRRDIPLVCLLQAVVVVVMAAGVRTAMATRSPVGGACGDCWVVGAWAA